LKAATQWSIVTANRSSARHVTKRFMAYRAPWMTGLDRLQKPHHK
jgi:hypothetical protein